MAIIKHKSQRVGIFIDTQNLYHSAKNLYRSKVNFGNVVKEALAGRQLIRAVAYVIRTESEEEKGFFEALNKLGIETKVKDIRIFAGGAKKADWDIGMAIDAIAMSEKLDAIILATGDGDFVPLVEYLRYTQGTQVEVIAFGKSASGQLKESVDDFTDMCENPKNFLLGYRGGSRWIPGFSSSGSSDEPAETSGGNEDPAIRMSGEE
ncbi:MAG: NYN domain-containing protein [Candidatus Adlerbacteria bacterium]|nr:NYN domain-containing protein [Candidatus Adlerbacteria bacterium]